MDYQLAGKIYIVIFIYFLAGAIGFYRISLKKPGPASKRNWIKLATYFVIIHVLYFSILFAPPLFRAITVVIAGMALIELYMVYRRSAMQKARFLAGSVFIWAVFSYGFYHFSLLNKEMILFTFLIVSIFDSFSQITGQLWGKKKIVPSVSPGKTVGGLIGGTAIALFSAIFLGMLLQTTLAGALLRALFIVLFAFGGDLLCSYYKRVFNTKDFSEMIPGHGGFLDRFDSLIAGGAWTAFSTLIFNELRI